MSSDGGIGFPRQCLGFKKGMAIASLNINGIRGHFDEIKFLLLQLGIHIMALNEIKIDPLYPKELTCIPGYEQVRLERPNHGGGVAIYIKDSIRFKHRNDIPTNGLETICIEVEPPKAKSFLILSWYRPPSDTIETFDKMEKILSYLDKEGKELILLGDTNCDFGKKENDCLADSNAKRLSNIYNIYSLKQLIENPTRATCSSSTIIDHIATSCVRNIMESGVYEVSMSDHYMVYCIRKFNGAVERDHKIIKTRKMKNFDQDAFLCDVSNICWEHIVTKTDNVNYSVHEWTNLLSIIIEKHAPLSRIRVSEKCSPWINEELKTSMRTRDRLKKVAIKSKSSAMMTSYRKARNATNALNTKLKKIYYNDRISACKGDIKGSWRAINEIINKKSKSTNIDYIKNHGQEISNNSEIANVMNNYFCTIGTCLAKNIEEAENPLLSGKFQIKSSTPTTFRFKSITCRDIREAIAKSTSSKSFGVDTISGYFLKMALPFLENSMAILFNTSLETSIFPDLWKIARVAPIYKEGDKGEKSNYRPISVLPVISRLFERLVYNQLYQHLNSNSLLANEQSGFRTLHPTLTCLLKNTDDWYSGLENGQLVGLLLIDLKKAFDTVDHSILCQKLEHYGLLGRELSWFKSYLSCRQQYCSINGFESDLMNIKIGVPQGSCLGPLLFLLYINDLPQAVLNSTVAMYADDTSLSYRSDDIHQLNETMKKDLTSVFEWLKGNKLSLNVAKTKTMLITTKQKERFLAQNNKELSLNIQEERIDNVLNAKYLGIQVDSNLNWKVHIKALSTKISRAIGFLKHSKTFLTRDTLKTLYTGIVEPHFRYCCSVWGSCGATERKLLQKLQNRAARILTNSPFDADARPLLNTLGLKTIQEMIDTETTIMVFKALNSLAPEYLSDLFKRNSESHLRVLRNTSSDLQLPNKTTKNGQLCFSYKGAKLWNALPLEIKQASSLQIFKQKFK